MFLGLGLLYCLKKFLKFPLAFFSHVFPHGCFCHFNAFSFDNNASTPSPSEGLDPSLISSIPLFIFKLDEHNSKKAPVSLTNDADSQVSSLETGGSSDSGRYHQIAAAIDDGDDDLLAASSIGRLKVQLIFEHKGMKESKWHTKYNIEMHPKLNTH
ncbi:hypothetical protein Goshw_025076 [Gossypium schwendimanii]|uniref:Uncharacterized protein n=1 Tax=Gossypium schwendimanii TaxID=34291 RepID=A0A7J9LRF9_GOSSC|nr:hypothetical protein [Gossypium schwendimanii]